jgi:hypothetical protein
MGSAYGYITQLASLALPMSEALQELEAHWKPDLPPGTAAMGDMARSLAKEIDRIPLDRLLAVFEFVEKLVGSDEEEISTVAATGFLEALLAEASGERLDFRRVAPLLGEESRKYCRAWDRFTGVSTVGLET